MPVQHQSSHLSGAKDRLYVIINGFDFSIVLNWKSPCRYKSCSQHPGIPPQSRPYPPTMIQVRWPDWPLAPLIFRSECLLLVRCDTDGYIRVQVFRQVYTTPHTVPNTSALQLHKLLTLLLSFCVISAEQPAMSRYLSQSQFRLSPVNPTQNLRTSTGHHDDILAEGTQPFQHSRAVKKRQKAELACNGCRRLRFKCDEGRPRCGKCQRDGKACVYRELLKYATLCQKHAWVCETNDSRDVRARLACNRCRKLKSKCDGGRPDCENCQIVGEACVYKEPAEKMYVRSMH